MVKRQVYEVEEIQDCRLMRNKLQYLIKWKGYSESENTWEPESNVETDDVILAFVEKLRKMGHYDNSAAYVKVIDKYSKESKVKSTEKKAVSRPKLTRREDNAKVWNLRKSGKTSYSNSFEYSLLKVLLMWVLMFTVILIPVLPLKDMASAAKEAFSQYNYFSWGDGETKLPTSS